MAATRGRLEGRITVPTGGWDTTVGGVTATVTAGTYYSATLLTEVGTRFATAAGTSCTASASLGESGTGLVTITFGSSKAITWVDTELRDILGFTGNLSAETSHVSTQQMRNVWLPNCPYNAPNSIDETFRGWREADLRTVENAAGYVWAHMGAQKEVAWLRWSSISRPRVWIANESTVNQSWERFVRDAIWGTAAWGTPGGPIRFFPDADSDSVSAYYMVVGYSKLQPEAVVTDWVGGPWVVELPRLIVVPGT